MAKKPSNAKLEREEEREHKDLDHDGEKGEPKAHREKVLGKKAVEKKDEKKDEKKSSKKDEKKDDKKDEKKPFIFTRPAPKPSEKAKKGGKR